MSSQYVLQLPEGRVSSDSDDDAPCEQGDEGSQDQQAGCGKQDREANIDGGFERQVYLCFVVRLLLNCHRRDLLRTQVRGPKYPYLRGLFFVIQAELDRGLYALTNSATVIAM